MTDTKKPRTARIPGFQANVSIFIPVDKNSLKSQAETSTALAKAEHEGDLSGVLALPGVRLVAIRNARYAPLASDPAAAAEEAGKEEGGQTDLEDAIRASEGEGEGEGADPSKFNPDDEAAHDAAIEAQHGGGRRRRA